MRWFDPNSRLAVTLRRLRGRFGIAAPRMSVRTHVPWHWRAASVIVITGASLALAGWVYDAGRRFAGIDTSATTEAVEGMRARIAELEAAQKKLQGTVNSSEASMQIEHTAQEQLKKQVADLGAENARLKEDLAVFEHMAQGEGAAGALAISRLRVEPADTAGGYVYRMLVTQQQGKKGNDFKGNLQFSLTLQQGNSNVMMMLPKAGDPGAGRYQVAFKHFQRLEGTFRIPEGSRLIAIEARLLQDGSVRATQRIAL